MGPPMVYPGRLRSLAPALLGVAGLACGEDSAIQTNEPSGTVEAQPKLLAMGSYAAPVGTLIEVYGSDLPAPGRGDVALVFQGTFTDQNGGVEPVSLESPVRWVDASTLRWANFGPYKNPFSPGGARIGIFRGTVAAKVTYVDGTQIVGTDGALDLELEVTPSIIVHELQPLTASCVGGVQRALGGASYRLEVEAVGFEPVSFPYSLSAPNVMSNPVSIRHLASSSTDIVDAEDHLTFPQVPEDMSAYTALLGVEARDADGRVRKSTFAIDVHRPIEVYYNGNVSVAQVMAPEPVSACIPGGLNGRSVSYAESQSETRSRSYQMSWTESWLSSHTVSAGSSQTIGLTETNGVGFSTTDGQSFNWSLGTEVSGSFGLDKLVSIGVGANSKVGGDVSSSSSNNQSRSEGVNQSSTTTETESVGQSNGESQGQGISWAVSSSEVISRSFGGDVIAGTYGVFYRQTLKLVRRGAVVAYNQCGYPQVVGEVDFTDWTWSPDLALGPDCPPLPASNLPSAECLIPPCDGN